MSKAAALSMLSGQPVTQANPSLVTPTMPTEIKTETDPKATHEAQAPTAESGAKTPTEEAQELQSSRVAIFAKKEAQLFKEREALKKEREEFIKERDRESGFIQKTKEFERLKGTDNVAALKALGYSDTDIINIVANLEPKQESAEEMARRIAREEATNLKTDLEKTAAEKEQDEQNKLVASFKSDISKTIKSQAEKYEFCNFEGEAAEALAYEFIVKGLQDGGEMLSIDEALQMAEDYYETRDKEMQAAIKKRQPANQEAQQTTIEAPKVEAQGIPQKPKTLNNSVSATVGGTIPRRETRQEKRMRLENALRMGGMQKG